MIEALGKKCKNEQTKTNKNKQLEEQKKIFLPNGVIFCTFPLNLFPTARVLLSEAEAESDGGRFLGLGGTPISHNLNTYLTGPIP